MASKATSLDNIIDALADAVPESLKHLKAFLAYEGENPKYYQKAKVAGGILGAYVKAEGTKNMRLAVEHSSVKMKELTE